MRNRRFDRSRRLSAATALLPAAAGPATAPSARYVGPTSTNTYAPLSPAAAVRVGPIPDDMRRAFDIPPFYAKQAAILGLPIIGSPKVSDWAFLECAYVVDHVLADSPPRVLDALHHDKVKVGIISVVEYTMDIPENQTQENMGLKAAAFQDNRSRGLGGCPLTTCAEENLLNLHGDPYRSEDITIHEFAHTIASALQDVDPAWYDRLTATYKRAMAAGRFADTYSATNEQEYWAEGAQMWFDCGDPGHVPHVHNGIWTRDQLKAYDPDLAALLAGVYGDGHWRYVRADNRPLVADGQTTTRPAADLAHLAGLDRDRMPTFDIHNSPRVRALAGSIRRAAASRPS